MTLAKVKRHAQNSGASLKARAEDVLKARAEAERVATMLAEVEDAFKTTARQTGETSITVNGTRVTAVLDAQRRKADLGVLQTKVGAEVFEAATKRAINWDGWDALTKLGMIPEEVRDEVVTVTLYDQVRVTN